MGLLKEDALAQQAPLRPGRREAAVTRSKQEQGARPSALERASRRGLCQLHIPLKHNAFSRARKAMQTPCRLGPPPQGPAGAACTPGRAAASGSPGRHTPGPGNRRRQQVPPFRAPACSRENVRPGKDECVEGSREERGRARYGRPGRLGCGAVFSRAGASHPPRGSGWLTRRGDAVVQAPRPRETRQGGMPSPVHVYTHGAPRRRMPSGAEPLHLE